MPRHSAPIEKPRKQPVQVRSSATVEAIFEATIQVLIRVGKEKLTTTLVARRAGVSVGTLYQYFPNKRSLLQATLRRKLTNVTEAIEHACEEARGKHLEDMVAFISDAFFRAKMKDPKGGLALYSVSSDLDGVRILEDLRIRTTEAMKKALASAPETLAISLDLAAFMLQAVMTGVSRRLLETYIPQSEHEGIRQQLATMLRAYVKTNSLHSAARPITPATT